MKNSIRTKIYNRDGSFPGNHFVIISFLSLLPEQAIGENKCNSERKPLFSCLCPGNVRSLININQEIINCFLVNKDPDTLIINKEFNLFNKSLQLEKNNITEPGEDKLVSGIETDYNEYRDSVLKYYKIARISC